MHTNAHKILKKLASGGSQSLGDLADLLKGEAKKLLTEKGGSRSASAAARQASSLARNHLRPLIRDGYVKRVGRGRYAATTKGTQAAGAKAAAGKKPAKSKPARKKPARRATSKPAKQKQSVASLRAELDALKAHLRQLAAWVEKVRASI